LITHFLREHMPVERGYSPHTCETYAHAFRLLFVFASQRLKIKPSQLCLEQIDAALILDFLTHIEDQRGNSIATRNQRLAALHSLFRFIARLVPELVDHAAQVQAIPLRRTVTPLMPYLDKHEIDALLAVPDRRRAQGRRDYALLLFLYNTGARATEAAQVTVADLSLVSSPAARFEGKGRYRPYLEAIPTHVITASVPALIGLRKVLGYR